jgi:hypothetical protein
MKKRREGGGELNQMDNNNNKRTKRCIDCDNELVPEYGHEVVVCEDLSYTYKETILVISKYRNDR